MFLVIKAAIQILYRYIIFFTFSPSTYNLIINSSGHSKSRRQNVDAISIKRTDILVINAFS